MAKVKYELNLMDNPLLPFRIRCWQKTIDNPPPNWHENTEILYCVSGSGFVKYNEKQFPVQAGDIIAVNSEMIHSVYSDEPMVYHFIIIDRNFCAANGIPTTNLYFQEIIRDPQLEAALVNIFETYEHFSKNSAFYEVAAIRSAVLSFLYLLCKDYIVREGDSANPHRNDMVKSAMIYIRKHLTERITLDDISQHVGVNKHYMSREFKRIIGKTIFDIILLMRCTEAKQRILEGMSVSQAARTCGFENLSYFTRAFKKYYQVLPSSYLQK